jgi:YfiH family protein
MEQGALRAVDFNPDLRRALHLFPGAARDARQPSRCATLRLMGFNRDAGHIYRVRELEAFPWLVHGFGTRNADIPGLFTNLATLKQIHSATCLPAGGRAGLIGEGDALLEDAPGAVVAVRTADCIPILLVDERRRAVAAVHAGWRGTAAGIARRAVKAMRERFGTDAGDVHAAIGPGIGECCFEVGPEVAAEFGRGDVVNDVGNGLGDDIAERSERLGTGQAMGLPHRVHIDLAAENRRQLLEAGVTGERIYTSNLCTKCLAGDFHSFRRDREAAGRLFSFAGIR